MKGDINITFCERLLEYRNHKGLSQNKLAEKVGVTRKTIDIRNHTLHILQILDLNAWLARIIVAIAFLLMETIFYHSWIKKLVINNYYNYTAEKLNLSAFYNIINNNK